jgi:hypothetical protein
MRPVPEKVPNRAVAVRERHPKLREHAQGALKTAVLTALLAMSTTFAAEPGVVAGRYLPNDVPLALDARAAVWTGAVPVFAELGRRGEQQPASRTEVRVRWSDRYLYLFYICPYQRLHLKPEPVTAAKTNHLWDWDVAEVFIGADPGRIGHYTEYEVSPQGEWVDLDIDRRNPASPGIGWNSGFEARASIDRERHVWYAAMKIPFAALGVVRPEVGRELRINFYRIEGAPPDRTYIVWQPVHSDSFHQPNAFGTLRLEKALEKAPEKP